MILEVKNITKHFLIQRGIFKKSAGIVTALDNVSFSVKEFDVLGIVGESGSGKTTLAKIILRLIPATSGEAIFNPQIINDFRRDVQIIFQNPYNSLNPKMRIADTLIEPLSIHNIVPAPHRKDRAIELLRMTGLDEKALNRFPGEFSGGQRQRICIARALASAPKLIVLDEPISSLDLTVQAQMLDLFLLLKEKFKLTYIFISHNLAVIDRLSDWIIVLHNGLVVESAKKNDIFNSPKAPYTRFLLESAIS